MTNEQPTALRLADALDSAPYSRHCTNTAAAELRRLHETFEAAKAVGIQQEQRIMALEAKNEALRNWIREQSSVTDTCIWNILREQCIGCQCHRSKK